MARQSKAEMLGLVERIVHMHDEEHLTFEQIADRLEGQVSRESARRCYAQAERKAEKYKLAAENAKTIIDAVKGTNMDLAEAANSMVANMFYDRILQMDEGDLDFENDLDFFKAMAPVMNNQARLVQARLSYQNGVEKCKAAVLEELARQLPDRPELLDALKDAVAAIKVKEK